MPLIDLQCTGDTPHEYEYMRPLADWPATPPCAVCGAATVQLHRPRATRFAIDPIVVYRAPDGSHRFPGDSDGAGARKYDALGYTRIECRTATEMHRLEARMNAHERAEGQKRVEAQAAAREFREAQARSQLRDSMRSFSEYGKDIARAAMALGDRKPREYTRDPGIHSEALAYDRGNRAEARGPDGRRRRD